MNAIPASLRDRELDVAREVAHAFLTASTPLEVYRIALARVTPLVRAKFSSVFQRDPADPTLLKLACAVSWPQSAARYLGQLRLRVGRGPTGRAVAELRPVEVEDVFADPALREWREPARELGFVSLISLPLVNDGRASGALTFYFDEPHEFAEDERHLLMLVADQLALASGRVEALYAERRELEQLRRENERLRERIGAGETARRMKDEFLSNISHELRTPLTSILGYAGLLMEAPGGSLDESQRNAVERIQRSAQVLLRLISDLLELSQVKLGHAMLNIAPDDAVLIARRALDATGPAQPGVRVSLETAEERMPLMTDGEKVVRILENLLSNAFKFTAAGSVTLTVGTITEAGAPAVSWTVTDTGIGIAADRQEEIFDEFRQVDGSSTRLYGGTGLGLALCRALARLLGGHITVRSEQGQGAEFRVVVPVSP
ncbi:MAG TPA: GAF domain-containing sensor histidine kinase [Longimicrobiales bacterium]